MSFSAFYWRPTVRPFCHRTPSCQAAAAVVRVLSFLSFFSTYTFLSVGFEYRPFCLGAAAGLRPAPHAPARSDGPAEGDSNARYGANMLPMDRAAPSVTSPIFRYPYSETKAALAQLAAGGNIDACHGVKMEYINPDNAGPVLPTLSAFMQQLPAGFRGENYQSTAAWVYHAVEGSGRTFVGDKILEWGPKDIFVVPAWYPHRHETDTQSFLYSFSDKGVHEKLGLFRDRRGADAEG